MSINSTPDTPTTDEQPGTDRAATAGDRLWAALHARPGGTADELSGDAGIGRSTAAKILARWITAGTAVRVPTDGRRSASRYAVPTSTDATPAGDTGDSETNSSSPPTGPADPTPDDTPPGTVVPTDAATEATGSTPDAPAGTDDGAEGDTDSTADDVASEPTTGASDTNDDPTDDTGPGSASGGTTAALRGPRLVPGALHGMVEDYLRDNPDSEFGPTKIGHDLGRSTGAVGNALERLVTSGYAVRTKDRPKRYALAPAATESSADAAPET